jgi:opacity protein-like surface antigen
MRAASGLLLTIALGVTAEPARAADPLGVYIGVAIGQADVRANELAFAGNPLGTGAVPLAFDEHHTGWKVLVGLRPVSIIGAELEYVDFGHPSAVPPLGSLLGIQADAHPKATTLSGIIYAPLPLPLLDLYGKVGLARLQTTVHATLICLAGGDCPPTPFIPPFALSKTNTSLAYGAGAQVKLSAFALRLEYERISASGGDPDLLSLGLTWRF